MQEKINEDIKTALKAGEKDKVEALKMVKTALQMAAIDEGGSLSEDKAISVLKKESKKRAEAAEMFKKGGNDQSAGKELVEKEIIDQYLPEQMSKEQVEQIVGDVLAGLENPNMGQVMGQVMQKVAGQADGGLVSSVVKDRISG